MDSIHLIFDLVFVFGVTFTLSSSKILSPIRSLLIGHTKLPTSGHDPVYVPEPDRTKMQVWFDMLLSCYFCTGFWVSLGVGTVSCLYWPVFLGTSAQYVLYTVGFGFVGATFCYILDTLLNYLENT